MSTLCRFIVEQGGNSYYCMLCDYYINGYDKVHYHANGNLHSNALNDYGDDIDDEGGNSYYCSLCHCSIHGYENVYNHLSGRRHESMLEDDDDDDDYDDDDDDDYEDYRIYGNYGNEAAGSNINDSMWPSGIFFRDFISRESRNEFYCILCDYTLYGYDNCMKHISSKNHESYVKKYGCDISPRDIDDDLYYCSCCDCTIPGYGNVNTHIMGKRHQSNLFERETTATAAPAQKEAIPILIDWKDCSDFACPFVSKEDYGIYYCMLCNIESHGNFSYENHIKSSSHKNAEERHALHISPHSFCHKRFYCKACDHTINCSHRINEHITGRGHISVLEQLESRRKSEEEERARREREEKERQRRVAEESRLKMETDEIEKLMRLESERWRKEAEDLRVRMEKAENWKREAEALKCEMEKKEAEIAKLEMEKTEERKRDRAARREEERREEERWKEERREAERWKKEAEDLKLEMDKAERWKREKAERLEEEKREAERWRKMAERRKLEMGKAEQWRMREEKIGGLEKEEEEEEEKSEAEGRMKEKSEAEGRMKEKDDDKSEMLKADKSRMAKKLETLLREDEERLDADISIKEYGEAERLKEDEKSEAERLEETISLKIELDNVDKSKKDDEMLGRLEASKCKEPENSKLEIDKAEQWSMRKEKTGRLEEEEEEEEKSEAEKRMKEEDDSKSEMVKADKRMMVKKIETLLREGEEELDAERSRKEKVEVERSKERDKIEAERLMEVINSKIKLEKSDKSKDKEMFAGLEASKCKEPKDSKLEKSNKSEVQEAESLIIDESEVQMCKTENQETIKFQKSPISAITSSKETKMMKKSNSSSVNLSKSANKDKTSNDTCTTRQQQAMKKYSSLLNFSADIYDIREKIREIKLGMELSIFDEDKSTYCLVCRKNIDHDKKNYILHLRELEHCEYLESMENDNDPFDLVPGQFSDLYLAYNYLEESSDETIKCLVCGVELSDVDENLQHHIANAKHRDNWQKMHSTAEKTFQLAKSSFSCDWYAVENYQCFGCNVKHNSEIDFVEHLRSSRHETFLEKLTNDRSLIYDYCSYCSLLIYGYRTSYANHSETSSHKWHTRNHDESSKDIAESAKRLMAGLEKYVSDTMNYLEKVEKNERTREAGLMKDLEKLARSKFKSVKAHALGPREYGCGSPDSRLSVFLDCGDMYDGVNSSHDHILKLTSTVHKSLSKDTKLWSTEKISTLIKNVSFRARHRATGLACEISFVNGLGVENTKLVKLFNEKFPSCRKLIIFVNQWLTLCNLSGTEPISSYALDWCVIFYLQKKSMLPSVAALMAMKNRSRVIAGWEVGRTANFTCDSTLISVTELAVGFFDFYANFDYRQDIACPLIGEILKKRDFVIVERLPREMALYVEFAKNSKDFQPFRIDAVMCVQDPLELCQNLTRSIGKADLRRFRTYCSKSLEILSSFK